MAYNQSSHLIKRSSTTSSSNNTNSMGDDDISYEFEYEEV